MTPAAFGSGALVARPLMPGETDHEALWLGASIGIGLCAALWLHAGLPLPHCFLHEWTGIPCPTCGGTRVVRLLLRGEFLAALKMNPLVAVGFMGTLLFNAYASMALLFRLPRLRPSGFDNRKRAILRAGACTLILANWLYLLATLP